MRFFAICTTSLLLALAFSVSANWNTAEAPPDTQPPAEEEVQVEIIDVPLQYQGSCIEWMIAAGVSDIANALRMMPLESNCNPLIVNRSSGACGIPQALPCSKMGSVDALGRSTVAPIEQFIWMESYVLERYGTWANAVNFRLLKGWY